MISVHLPNFSVSPIFIITQPSVVGFFSCSPIWWSDSDEARRWNKCMWIYQYIASVHLYFGDRKLESGSAAIYRRLGLVSGNSQWHIIIAGRDLSPWCFSGWASDGWDAGWKTVEAACVKVLHSGSHHDVV